MKAPPYDQSSLWKMASPFIEDPGAGAQIMRGVLTLLSSVFHSFPCQNHFGVFLYTDIILYQRLRHYGLVLVVAYLQHMKAPL